MSGQKIQLPPNPQDQPTDLNPKGMATKKLTINNSLNILHQYLIFQVYVPQGSPFQLELHVRDKMNVSLSILSFSSESVQKPVIYYNFVDLTLIYSLFLIYLQVKRRLMFVEGTKNLLTNQTAAKIPTQEIVPRNIWLNLCIDVNSFIKECFSKHSALNNTP